MLKENEHQNVLHCLYGCVSSREWGGGGRLKTFLSMVTIQDGGGQIKQRSFK